jgi:putative FmdB family regulatory protein
MPVYEYQCKGCGHEFEREQRISDAPIKKCPSCGAQKARRQISRTSFVLKGGGWYSDLYGSAKPAGGR